MKPYRSLVTSPIILAFAILLCSGSHPVRAQATQAADQRIRLTAFALASYVRTNYNGSSPNKGFTLGGEIDGFRFLPHTDLGMDIRYTASRGDVSNQFLFEGGPRVSFNAYRLRPYAAYLVGLGRSNFTGTASDPTYTFDKTRTRGYDAGFDMRVSRFWSLRADAQRQRWRFSVHVPPFYPVEVSVGAAYQVHFRSRHGPQ